MSFALQLDGATPLLIAYETVDADIDQPQPTIQAQLIAGWNCPECGEILRAIAGPWSNQKIGWWSYDHGVRAYTSGYEQGKGSVRATSPGHMPRFRGKFTASGGWLRRFDHHKPLVAPTGYSHAYTTRCELAPSMRVGIEGGVSALPDISASARERLIEAIEHGQHTDQLVLIPELTGQREPIIATKQSAARSWRNASDRAYDEERKAQTWEIFLPTLINQ